MDVNDDACCLDERVALAIFASRLAPTGRNRDPAVGASLLAMDVNDDARCLDERVAQTIFASKLAPTGATASHVGASLLAMDVNDDAFCLDERVVARRFSRASSLLQGQPHHM